MKTHSLILAIVFSIISMSAFAQKKQSSAGGDFMKDMLYDQLKSAVTPSSKLTTSTIKDYSFPWDNTLKNDKPSLANALDTIDKNFICEKDDDNLEIKSSFPPNYKIESELFNIEILKVDLKNEKREAVELNTNMKFINFGNKFHSSFSADSDGNTSSENTNTITVNKTVPIKTVSEKIEGTISVKSSFITGYNTQKLTSADIGKEIVFNGQKIKLISINKNIAIIKMIEGSADFDYLITNSNNQPYNGGLTKMKIAQQDYDYFAAKPNQTVKEFTPYYESNKDRIFSKDSVKDLLILTSDGEITNLYIYSHSEELSKISDIKVQL